MRWLGWMLLTTAAMADSPTLPTFTRQEAVQAAMSQKLTQIEAEMRQMQREKMDVTLADVQAVLQLSAERQKLLKVGMQGVIHAAADKLRANQLRNLEQRLVDATPETVEKILKSYRSGYTLGNLYESPEWRSVLSQLLSEDELKRWQTALEERKAYREQAITEALTVEAEVRVGLTSEQVAKLRPQLEKAVKDYLPDLNSIYSDYSDRSISTEYVPVLLMGIEEAVAKSIISDPKQWERWQAAPGQYKSNWDWIKRNHESRLKREAKGL